MATQIGAQCTNGGGSKVNLAEQRQPGTALEVGKAFLKLGLSSFGGPIAHLAYFRREFVERRQWLDERSFVQLVALCQSLPGPASSQLGFCIGLLRAGFFGALAAFLGFTLPSALLLYGLAASSHYLSGAWDYSAIHGLKLVAVAVVSQGVLGMARTLTPDAPRALIAVAAAGVVTVSGNAWMPLLAIAGGAALGPWVCRGASASRSGAIVVGYGRRTGAVLLMIFGILLVLALVAGSKGLAIVQVAAAFYRAGALVFGGGHVVLPLLKQAIVDPGWIDNATFLSGYGAAQAAPGPIFSVAAFFGEALNVAQSGAIGAAVSLLAIFLPGLLVVAGALPFWQLLSSRNETARMLAGVNAVVVGLLAAALYDPVWVSGILDGKDFAIALVGFALLAGAKWPSWTAVIWCVSASLLNGWLTEGRA